MGGLLVVKAPSILPALAVQYPKSLRERLIIVFE